MLKKNPVVICVYGAVKDTIFPMVIVKLAVAKDSITGGADSYTLLDKNLKRISPYLNWTERELSRVFTDP